MAKSKCRIIFLAAVLTAAVINTTLAEGNDMDAEKRKLMVAEQISSRGISDKRVLDAMLKVERHLFVPDRIRELAYEDEPLPIGYGQTISQPFIVAYMTEAARLKPDDKVLEIGTGSGYQAAILAEVAKEVYSIEIVEELADQSRGRLASLGYKNVEVRYGDGYKGWPEQAPFDVIIITAAPPEIPTELLSQMKVGARMVVPVGSFFQELVLITRTKTGFDKRSLIPVRFVPMIRSNK